MPFRDYDFDGDALFKMTAAYDAVVARLYLQTDDPRTSTLAANIVALAAEGERDVEKLTERVASDLNRLYELPTGQLRRTRSTAAGNTQSLKGAPLRKAPGLRACTGT
jgi:hypothetical protein